MPGNLKKLGRTHLELAPMAYGCYSASGAYGQVVDENTLYKLIKAAKKRGIPLIDTAPLYGQHFGENEKMLGRVFRRLEATKKIKREEFFLSDKCGFHPDGSLDNSPAFILNSCAESLKRLQVDYIDLYILHRYDPRVSIEEIAKTMCDLIDQGKIKHMALSEVGEKIIRGFYAALQAETRARNRGKKYEDLFVGVQSEYSIANRAKAELVLPVCRELGLTFFAYSPLGRALLTNAIAQSSAVFSAQASDFRTHLPQFQPSNMQINQEFARKLKAIADTVPCTTEALALAWLIEQENVVPVFSASSKEHLLANIGAKEICLEPATREAIRVLCQNTALSGPPDSPFLQKYAESLYPSPTEAAPSLT